MRFDPHFCYDAIVVGSGATGAVAAHTLAQQGLRVLVLEAGSQQSPGQAFGFEPLNSLRRITQLSAGKQLRQSEHPGYWKNNPNLYVDEVLNPYTTPPDRPFLWTRGRQVGGKSLSWGGITLRLSDQEFQQGWPICHQDLNPHYSALEQQLGVWGARDGLALLPDGNFAPPAPFTPGELLLQQACKKLGLPFIASRGFARHQPHQDGPWPRYCAQGGALKAAMATGLVTLRSGAIVAQLLLTPAQDQLEGVLFIDAATGAMHRAMAKLVLLCASTIESLRLLLLSRDDRCSNGLIDPEGLLGLGLMDHVSVARFFTLPPQPAALPGTGLSGAESAFIPNTGDGYGLWCGVQRFDPPALLRRDAKAAIGFLIGHGEVLPDRRNFVALDFDCSDAWGLPVPHISMAWGQAEQQLVDLMLARIELVVNTANGEIKPIEELFRLALIEPWVKKSAAGSQEVPPPGYYIHELGGAPMGDNAAVSVLDRWNRFRTCPNLLVTDGTCWTSSGWQSPTLTSMALTRRACIAAIKGQ
jgi:choline dehydrogenase-like flavoprotein